ncbi:MAG TPA: hypothetical protein VHC97_00805 [Thermoanaerobaculia bacterium]|nr:hypothetical protein [Thermoanaerobaculia bacterium]
MRTVRFAAALLAGLVLAGGHPAGAKKIKVGGMTIAFERSSKELARAITLQVGEVRDRFSANRRALSTVPGPDGKPAYLPQEVNGLILRTREDLDKAIEKAQPAGTEPLRAWSAAEIDRIQQELAAATPIASFSAPSSPRAVAVAASLREFGLPMFASAKPPRPKPAPPKPAPPKPVSPKPVTVTAGTADRILDEVGEVVNRIFVLASHDDLEVKLWVGSTPTPKATFRFWPQGNIKGSPPDPLIVQTDGKKDHVLRGLYSYRVSWGKGAVTQVIEYPNPTNPSAVGMASERLDLVNGSSFFCCQLNDGYCRHVDDEKECRR